MSGGFTITEHGISLCVVDGKFVGLARVKETIAAQQRGEPEPYGLSAAALCLLASMVARACAPAQPEMGAIAEECDALLRHLKGETS